LGEKRKQHAALCEPQTSCADVSVFDWYLQLVWIMLVLMLVCFTRLT